jgi:hypothetical protein
MLGWLKRRFVSDAPSVEPVDPDVAVARLRQLTSDVHFEEVWDALDTCGDAVEAQVREAISNGELGPYPMHAARLWLAYRLGVRERLLETTLVAGLEESITWALAFDENTVLLGIAVGALDSLGVSQREGVALRAFTSAGVECPRRYWLLLKVRTEAMLQAVFESLADFRPADTPDADPDDEGFIYTPTAANRMAGAFRQFSREDFVLLRPHFDLASPGAQFVVDAIGSTGHPDALPLLQEATSHERSAVRAAALQWINSQA